MMKKTILLSGVALLILGSVSMAGDQWPWIGVKVDRVAIPGAFAKHLGLNPGQGMRINNIAVGSPAEKAGLERDDIILSVQGEKATSLDSVTNALHAAIGKQASLEVLHLGQRKTVEVHVGSLAKGLVDNSELKYPWDDFNLCAIAPPGAILVVRPDRQMVPIGLVQNMGLTLQMLSSIFPGQNLGGVTPNQGPAGGQGMPGMSPYPGPAGGQGVPGMGTYPGPTGGQAMPGPTPYQGSTPSGCSISGIVQIDGPQMGQTNVRKLLVIAFEPVLNQGRVTGAGNVHYAKLSAFQQPPSMMEGILMMGTANWTVDGLKSGTGYVVHLIYDQNGNGVFDMSTDGVLASPGQFSPTQTITAPAQGITLTFMPPWPTSLP